MDSVRKRADKNNTTLSLIDQINQMYDVKLNERYFCERVYV